MLIRLMTVLIHLKLKISMLALLNQKIFLLNHLKLEDQ